MPANLIYEDGSYLSAEAISLPVFSAPFAQEGVNERYLLTQRFCQNLSDFVALPLDTPHPDHTTYILVQESEHEDLGGGKVAWMRTYAKVPTSYNRPGGTITYSFIGFEGIGGINTPSASYRPRVNIAVPTRITKDFYNTSDADTIPIISATRYYLANDPAYGRAADIDVDGLTDSPPFDASSLTVPSRTTYEGMIDAGTWNIVVEPSRVYVWMGNIYVRETLYIKAQ